MLFTTIALPLALAPPAGYTPNITQTELTQTDNKATRLKGTPEGDVECL